MQTGSGHPSWPSQAQEACSSPGSQSRAHANIKEDLPHVGRPFVATSEGGQAPQCSRRSIDTGESFKPTYNVGVVVVDWLRAIGGVSPRVKALGLVPLSCKTESTSTHPDSLESHVSRTTGTKLIRSLHSWAGHGTKRMPFEERGHGVVRGSP